MGFFVVGVYCTVVPGGAKASPPLPGASSKTDSVANRTTRLFGESLPASVAERTIDLRGNKGPIFVKSGETVEFVGASHDVVWHFAESRFDRLVNLGVLLPQVPEASGISIHINRGDLYRN